MKILKILFYVFTSVAIAISCSDEKSELLEDSIMEDFIELKIPKTYLSDKTDFSGKNSLSLEVETVKIMVTDDNGNEVIGYARFTMPENSDDKLVKAEFTSNIINKFELSTTFWQEAVNASPGSASGKSSCIASCHEEFTDDDGEKIKGRGWCKAQCWAAAVATAVVTVVIAII